MPTTFLNLSIAVESDAELDTLYVDLKDRMEYLLEDIKLQVFHITWDREQALRFVRGRSHTIEVLTKARGSCPPLASSVATVLAQYNFTLPKQKKGAPEWKVPKGPCFGEIEGLPGLRGKVVLTNGIKAFLVRQDGAWADVHWDWFKPDHEEDIPDGVEKPKGRNHKVDHKVERCFAGF